MYLYHCVEHTLVYQPDEILLSLVNQYRTRQMTTDTKIAY